MQPGQMDRAQNETQAADSLRPVAHCLLHFTVQHIDKDTNNTATVEPNSIMICCSGHYANQRL